MISLLALCILPACATAMFIGEFLDQSVTRADTNVNKHNAELQRADPGTKDIGQFSTTAQGRIFPHNAQKGF